MKLTEEEIREIGREVQEICEEAFREAERIGRELDEYSRQKARRLIEAPES